MILLDTHTVLWLTGEKANLSDAAVQAIRSASREGSGLAISGQTLWEIAWIATRGSIRLRGPLSEYLRYLEKMCTVLPITAAIAEQSVMFSDRYSKNPTDRLIGATAVIHGLKLITKDELIRRSGEVDCIW